MSQERNPDARPLPEGWITEYSQEYVGASTILQASSLTLALLSSGGMPGAYMVLLIPYMSHAGASDNTINDLAASYRRIHLDIVEEASYIYTFDDTTTDY